MYTIKGYLRTDLLKNHKSISSFAPFFRGLHYGDSFNNRGLRRTNHFPLRREKIYRERKRCSPAITPSSDIIWGDNWFDRWNDFRFDQRCWRLRNSLRFSVDKTASLSVRTSSDCMKSFTNFGFVFWMASHGTKFSSSMGELTFQPVSTSAGFFKRSAELCFVEVLRRGVIIALRIHRNFSGSLRSCRDQVFFWGFYRCRIIFGAYIFLSRWNRSIPALIGGDMHKIVRRSIVQENLRCKVWCWWLI